MKWIVIVAIVCIAGLEGIALIKEVDGALFGFAVMAISGLGGYQIKVIRDKRKGGTK